MSTIQLFARRTVAAAARPSVFVSSSSFSTRGRGRGGGGGRGTKKTSMVRSGAPPPANADPWEKVTASDGQIYWWNTSTDETTELGAPKPVLMTAQQQQEQAIAQAQAQQGPLGGGGFMGMMAQGMAFGAGSSMAHHAIGGLFGGGSNNDEGGGPGADGGGGDDGSWDI